MTLFLLRLLPRKALSALIGFFVDARRPRFFATLLKNILIRSLHIDPAEGEHPPRHYACFGEYFTRSLKAGARPLGDACLISPCDGVLTQWGDIGDGEHLIQAKGIDYSLSSLIPEAEIREPLVGGACLTLYLAPHHYHRVHAPIAGQLRLSAYQSGDLWPVNADSVRRVPRLFAINERWYGLIESKLGPLAMVMVGATNVGRITLDALSAGGTTRGTHPPPQGLRRHNPAPRLEKGSPYATFNMGSTVIVMLGPELKGQLQWPPLLAGEVRMGQNLLTLRQS